jgi:IstB-like ATP binding protein
LALGLPPRLAPVLTGEGQWQKPQLLGVLDDRTWHQAIGEATIADAICDRLVHNAHLVTLRGGSMRKKKAISTEGTESKN